MVYVRFVVERDGSVGDVEVLRSVHPLLDEEAVRVVETFPGFRRGCSAANRCGSATACR